MPKYVVHFTFLFFFLTSITGVWMRLYSLSDEVHFLPYDHILHAHSHIAILGWTFLAMLVLYLKINWKYLDHLQKEAKGICISTGILTFFMFIAFLLQGYALYSIIFSTIHILLEYWAIFFMLRSFKMISDTPPISKLFMKGAFLTLFISSLGPWSLGLIASQNLQKSALFDMAIYFYLHFQYNGWLYLMFIGIFIISLAKKGIHLHKHLLSVSFWFYIFSLFPGYFLSILWYDVGKLGALLGIVGAVGQLIGVLLFCFTLFKCRYNIRRILSKRTVSLLIIVVILLLSKSVLELFLIYTPLAMLVYETRTVVIGYLHLVLLGFVSLFILMLFHMEKIIDETSQLVKIGTIFFLTGFVLNEFILFLSGLLSWLEIKTVFFQIELLTIAAVCLACGILIIWSSLFVRKQQVRL